MTKALSYSEYFLWNRSRGEHYKRYILGEQDEPTMEMRLGSLVHKVIEEPRIKESAFEALDENVPSAKARNLKRLIYKAILLHPKESEKVIRAKLRDSEGIYEGVSLLAIFDGYYKKDRVLREFKTTNNSHTWTQHRVNTNDQLSFYAYCYWLNYHKFFRQIELYRLNTEDASIKKYETARGWQDIIHIEQKIKKCVDEMVEAGIWHKRISSYEAKLRRQGQKPLPIIDKVQKI